MNIFLTDPCPVVCAVNLDDARVQKMAVETAQLLSTAINTLVPLHDSRLIYRSAYFNHPCGRWARACHANFNWLVEHGLTLCRVYSRTYGKIHRSERVIREASAILDDVASDPEYALCPLITYNSDFLTRPLEFTFNSSGFDTGNLYRDYQLCMIRKWKDKDPVVFRPPTWGTRGPPPFWLSF